MRTWTNTLTHPAARQNAVRAGLAALLVAALVCLLPTRPPGQSGSHHARLEPVGDPFERAGVVEFKEGQRGPAFRLARWEGGDASLDTWGDRLVVLNFWATWCTPCAVEMPTLERLWRQYGPRGLVVVGISVDRGAPRALLEPYIRHLGLTFPILLDPDWEVAQAWRVTGLPATFLVKPGGEVAGMALGAREWDSAEMKALLDTLLPAAHRH